MAQAPDPMRSTGRVERQTPPDTLEITRIFEAPRDLVWRAWTDARMTAQWLGPVEWPASLVTQDLQIGGYWSAILTSAETGNTLSQSGLYRVIDPPERLVFTFSWGEGHEDGLPVETLVEIELIEIAANRTLMSFTQTNLKSADSVSGHRHGWTSTFDRLEQLLANHSHRSSQYEASQ